MNEIRQVQNCQLSTSLPHSCITLQRENVGGFSFKPMSTPQIPIKQSPNKEIQRMTINPTHQKLKQRYNLQEIKTQVRNEFEKKSYKQNLIQIQHIIKNVKQLCKIYGYFFITQAMFQFNFDNNFIIDVWIHPDSRSNKPLHPIRKQNQFQCQLICVSSLKLTLKHFFPSFDFTTIKTFSNILAYIDSLKNDWQGKNIKTPTLPKKNSRQYIGVNKKQNKNTTSLMVSLKNIPIFDIAKIQQQDDNKKKFIIDNALKQTKSTLIQTIRSANSFKQKLTNQINIQTTPLKQQKQKQQDIQIVDQKKKRTISLVSLQPKHFIIASTVKSRPTTPNNQLQQKQQIKNQQQIVKENTHKIYQDKSLLSTSTKRVMSMSIQIQSQINNLFGYSDELALGSNYYTKSSELQGVRNSVLSKVAEEFQDLF